jgi:hypothetical protein
MGDDEWDEGRSGRGGVFEGGGTALSDTLVRKGLENGRSRLHTAAMNHNAGNAGNWNNPVTT